MLGVARVLEAVAQEVDGPDRLTGHHRGAGREQRDVVADLVSRYNPDAVLCVGIPFGHTRPQWILPYGGELTVDGVSRTVWADYR